MSSAAVGSPGLLRAFIVVVPSHSSYLATRELPMYRPTKYAFAFIPLLAAAVVWGNSSDPTQLTQPPPADSAVGATSEHLPRISTGYTGTGFRFTDLGYPGSARVLSSESTSTTFNPKFVLNAMHHGPNHPPVVNSPTETHIRVVLFPGGPGATLEFKGEPATDHENDILTYRFGFAIPGKLGIQPPEKALLQITREGNGFLIRPYGIHIAGRVCVCLRKRSYRSRTAGSHLRQ